MTLMLIKLTEEEIENLPRPEIARALGGHIMPGWDLPPGTERNEAIRLARQEWAEKMTPAPEEEVVYGENSGVAE